MRKPAPAEQQSDELNALQHKVKTLESQLKAASKAALSDAYVRQFLTDAKQAASEVPEWLAVPRRTTAGAPGVPSVIWSDWHFGETVYEAQVSGANEYNLDIAEQRVKHLVTKVIDLLMSHVVNPKFPGIVVNIGGDMVTGDIHEELTATNDAPIMGVILRLLAALNWAVGALADTFKRVHVVCVTGNHGRSTKRLHHKNRHFESFDWLTYQLLSQQFANDRRVTFTIPDAADALYKIYDTRYLLTHGDQFRGGDGMIGALGPILRGDHKKRSRNNGIGMDYDVMLMGHWHQLMSLRRVVVNGSLIGYNEYAYAGNFPFEPPAQALWLTHPKYGPTISMPVWLGERSKSRKQQWFSDWEQ